MSQKPKKPRRPPLRKELKDPRLWNEDGTRKTCGAITTLGAPCKALALANGKCRKHGGSDGGRHGAVPRRTVNQVLAKSKQRANAAGNTRGEVHGIYGGALRPDELEIYATMQLGNVDDELRMLRIQLRRCLLVMEAVAADPLSEDNKAGMELHEVTTEEGERQIGREAFPVDVKKIVRKRVDLVGIHDKLVSRIAQLEKLRADLLEAGMGGSAGHGVDGLEVVEYGEEEQS